MTNERICPLLWIVASIGLLAVDKKAVDDPNDVAETIQTIGMCQREKCQMWSTEMKDCGLKAYTAWG